MDNRICTLYYNTEIDSQRLKRVDPDSYSYIKPWYESVLRLGLRGIVFHDSLSEDFIAKYGNGNVEFIKFQPGKYKAGFRYSMEGFNDGRFPLYLDYLENHALDNVLFTDCHDVVVNMDPFAGLAGIPERLFCGSERVTLSGNKWLEKKFNVFAEGNCKNVYDWYIGNPGRKTLSAGIVGGGRDEVLGFLRSACGVHGELVMSGGRHNLNMAVFNYAMYNLGIPFATGYPVHNLYKRSDRRKDVWITHK